MASEWGKLEWMGRRVRVTFAPHWPATQGEYEYQGFDEKGVWLLRDDGWQRHLLYCDIAKVELL